MLAYVGTPIREGLEPFGAEYGQVFLDLPVPVDRAALGFGVSVSAVEIAMAQSPGIVVHHRHLGGRTRSSRGSVTWRGNRKAWAVRRLKNPVDEWGKLLGDTAAVTALLDRLLHHAHLLKCGPRSWRTRVRNHLANACQQRTEVVPLFRTTG